MKYQDYKTLNEDEGGEPSNVTANAETDVATGFPNTSFSMFSRITMPQIPKEMKSQFHDDLKLNGYNIETCDKKCDSLMPTQTEFNDEKVDAIKASIVDGTYIHEPILVSSDDMIVDGHHRWKAMKDSHRYIPSDVVDMPFKELYDFLDNKTYVVKRDI